MSVTVALVLVLVLGVAAAGSYVVTWQLRKEGTSAVAVATAPPAALAGATASPLPTASPSLATSSPVTPVTGTPVTGTPPPAGALSAALASALADPRLGGQLVGQVSDAVTGAVLLDRSAAIAVAPASTAKIATAAAVLRVHKSTDRITTRVVAGPSPGAVVLVGAGDPTLSAVPAGTAPPYPDAARISDLAAQLAGAHVTSVIVDDSLFTGPAVSAQWQPEDVPSSYASPVTALMADGGRDTPGALLRSAAPQLAAGKALAADLGLPPAAVTSGVAAAGAALLASVGSATYGELVQQMLSESDDVIGEVLGRQVALAAGQPASFAGAAAAIRAALTPLGLDIGAGLVDASGLSVDDRLAPAALVDLLRVTTGDTEPALNAVAADLPVAAWDGTLATRYTSAPSNIAAGLVRAKTGTLTGVSTLAGIAPDASGRLLVFSFAAEQVGPSETDTANAEAGLDTLAAAVVGCACG